jgi:hypothetical protein
MNEETITFHFDELVIAIANKTYVWLPGNYGYYPDDKPCLIKMKNTQFIKALKDWIAKRAEYNKINAYGAGFTEITKYKELPEISIHNFFWKYLLNSEDCENNIKEITVPVIEVIEYESEMEHG